MARPLFLLRALVLAVSVAGVGALLSSPAEGGATPAPIGNVTAFLEECPTEDPMYAQIRADFELRREGVVVGAIACTEPISAMPIAQYTDELVMLQALRAIYYMEGGREVAYPWTPGSLYDWMKLHTGGIDIRFNGSYCCEWIGGEWFPVIASQNDWDRDDAREWRGLSQRITLLAHEVRHVQGFGHVGGCPLFPDQLFGCDPTYDEGNLAAYGLEWWLHSKWLSGELDVGYACLSPGVRADIGAWHRDRANNDFQGRFVTNAPPVLSIPAEPDGPCGGATQTATATATPTASPTLTLAPTASPTLTASPTTTASPTVTPTLAASPTPSPTATPTPSPTATAPVATDSASPTAEASGSPALVTPTPTGPLPPAGPTQTGTPASPTPLASSIPTPTPTGDPPAADVDCDGDVDTGDGLEILRSVAGLPLAALCGGPTPVAAVVPGDVDCDGHVDAGDMLAVVRYVAGLGTLGACGGERV